MVDSEIYLLIGAEMAMEFGVWWFLENFCDFQNDEKKRTFLVGDARMCGAFNTHV